MSQELQLHQESYYHPEEMAVLKREKVLTTSDISRFTQKLDELLGRQRKSFQNDGFLLILEKATGRNSTKPIAELARRLLASDLHVIGNVNTISNGNLIDSWIYDKSMLIVGLPGYYVRGDGIVLTDASYTRFFC